MRVPIDDAPPYTLSEEQTQKVLAELVAGTLGPLTKLSETIGLTLDQTVEWVANPLNRARIANLVELLDAQAQLLICQYRTSAVARLIHVAATAPSPETVRRACVDLLRVRLNDPYREDVRPETPLPRAVIDTEAILAELQQLGEDHRRKDAEAAAKFEEWRLTQMAYFEAQGIHSVSPGALGGREMNPDKGTETTERHSG